MTPRGTEKESAWSWNTPVLTITSPLSLQEHQARAVAELMAHHVIVIPTDTVYGIALLASPATYPRQLAAVKERPEEKGIPLLVSHPDDLERYGTALPGYAKELCARYWPGALTLVVRASEAVPPQYVGEDGSIALRMPRHSFTLSLLKEIDTPLACTSANLAGRPPATSLENLDAEVARNVALIIDGGVLPGGIASTVVSCLEGEPQVLRSGPVSISI